MSSSDRVENPGRVTVGIIGLGSIGGVVAGLLRAVDRHDVVACVRRPIERLVIERAEGAIDVSMRALTDPAHAKPRDWVLLCTKAYDTASSAPWLARLCGPNTRVAVLQNGIGHADRLAPLIGAATVVPTIVYYNGERLAPDRVRFRRAGEYDFAVSDDSDGRAFAELLDGTSMLVLRSPDFNTLAWRNSSSMPLPTRSRRLRCSGKRCSDVKMSKRSALSSSKRPQQSAAPMARGLPQMRPSRCWRRC